LVSQVSIEQGGEYQLRLPAIENYRMAAGNGHALDTALPESSAIGMDQTLKGTVTWVDVSQGMKGP
jgi:hypothetical protein